jgi:hypothetical protein
MNWKIWKHASVEAPASNETQQLDTIQLTYVRWRRRYGEFSTDTEMCFEAFPSEDDANKFAESLRNAFKLLRHTSGTKVEVYKR